MTGSSSNNRTGRSRIDWGSVAIFFVLMALGWLNIYAAVFDDSAAGGFSMSSRYGSQLVWMGVCVLAAAVIMLIDEIYYHILAYPSYVLLLAVLLATLFLGTEVNGAKSWLRFGGFSLQPAEFAKFTTALALARYMSSYSFSMADWRSRLYAMLLLAAPMAVILLQNDAGSAIVFASFLIVFYREGFNSWVYVALGMVVFLFVFSFLWSPAALLAAVLVICTLLEGIMNGGWTDKVRYLAAVALAALAIYLTAALVTHGRADFYPCLLAAAGLSLVAAGIYAWRTKLKNVLVCIGMFVGAVAFTNVVDVAFAHLQIHQQKRILDLLGVESDLQYWGYNVNQSKIAIGSGGFFGKGYLQGTQTKYDFVPEQSTDFIFCTVGEEWGFVGSAVVLGLFCWLILRLIKMGERQQEAFGRVYCYGVASIFFFHVLVNVGMTIGIMPVIGIPLPLFSYGGSSLFAFTLLFFVAVKLDSRRRESDGH
ncbi:MAG TPA: rod shape-determining protein RodA [Candidatus Tidjanibacter gallistercoris]|nr:rod shape-determining protein RodA [Candidatus Tidjanibacter gallistercoris]